jgi:hypothetical protein
MLTAWTRAGLEKEFDLPAKRYIKKQETYGGDDRVAVPLALVASHRHRGLSALGLAVPTIPGCLPRELTAGALRMRCEPPGIQFASRPDCPSCIGSRGSCRCRSLLAEWHPETIRTHRKHLSPTQAKTRFSRQSHNSPKAPPMPHLCNQYASACSPSYGFRQQGDHDMGDIGHSALRWLSRAVAPTFLVRSLGSTLVTLATAAIVGQDHDLVWDAPVQHIGELF